MAAAAAAAAACPPPIPIPRNPNLVLRRSGLSATVGMARKRKFEAFVTNPHLEEGPNQRGIGGMDPSVYLSVCRRDSDFGPSLFCPLYKVNVHGSSLPGAPPAARESLRPIGRLLTGDQSGMTFVSFLPRRWIIGVGGDPGGTIIIDTKSPKKVINGPDLLASKWCPVVAAVGNKVYALSGCPAYKTEPDFVPWFEVLDLSKGKVTKDADGSLSLDDCFWEELPCPPFFPRKLSPTGYLHPPLITVRSYVVVLPYILISLNEQLTSCTYVFDTTSGEWHKIDGKSLPFIGPATPHGSIFLGSSIEKRLLNAYCIRVSTSPVSSKRKGSALKLSITACKIRNKAHEPIVTVAAQYITSLDRGCFSVLTFSLAGHKYIMGVDSFDDESFSTKLVAKLTTYHIEKPALLEERHEIAVSKQWGQEFKFFCSYGFSSPPISFTLSI